MNIHIRPFNVIKILYRCYMIIDNDTNVFFIIFFNSTFKSLIFFSLYFMFCAKNQIAEHWWNFFLIAVKFYFKEKAKQPKPKAQTKNNTGGNWCTHPRKK